MIWTKIACELQFEYVSFVYIATGRELGDSFAIVDDQEREA